MTGVAVEKARALCYEYNGFIKGTTSIGLTGRVAGLGTQGWTTTGTGRLRKEVCRATAVGHLSLKRPSHKIGRVYKTVGC